jgi:hypothetical protein
MDVNFKLNFISIVTVVHCTQYVQIRPLHFHFHSSRPDRCFFHSMQINLNQKVSCSMYHELTRSYRYLYIVLACFQNITLSGIFYGQYILYLICILWMVI